MLCFQRLLPSRAVTVLVWLCIAGFIFLSTSAVRGPRSSYASAPAIQDVEPRNCSLVKSSPPGTIDSVGIAPALSPAELLCRPQASNTAAVPKLFHQSWKTPELPAKFQRWSNSCRKQHPDWEWVLWTDEDNLRLVQQHFPWLLDTFLKLPGPIYRADLARNLYMQQFGGVYADLDTECLRPVSHALGEHGVVFSDASNTAPPKKASAQDRMAFFGRMGSDDDFSGSLPNAWMASSPGHSFFLLPLEMAQAEMSANRSFFHQLLHSHPSAEQLTGPGALRKTILEYNSQDHKDKIILLPEHSVYPFNWNSGNDLRAVCSAEQSSFDERQCKTNLEVDAKGSISITYWSHTHKGKGSNTKNINNISHD